MMSAIPQCSRNQCSPKVLILLGGKRSEHSLTMALRQASHDAPALDDEIREDPSRLLKDKSEAKGEGAHGRIDR
jgi:hypothetical protein